jgi:hypothetical protein
MNQSILLGPGFGAGSRLPANPRVPATPVHRNVTTMVAKNGNGNGSTPVLKPAGNFAVFPTKVTARRLAGDLEGGEARCKSACFVSRE